MYAFLLDTSTQKSFIALSQEGKIIDSCLMAKGPLLSKEIAFSIQNLFQKYHILVKDLDYIALGIGPGSYTGLRVGAIIAKSFRLAHQIPIVGFCSLYGFIPDQSASFVSVIDARSGGLYVAEGIKQNQNITFSDPQVISIEEASPLLEHAEYVITPDLQLKERISSFSKKVQEKGCDLEFLSRFAQKKFKGKEFLEEEFSLLYLRSVG